MPIIITHTMNVYGNRQHPEKFIPIIINKVLSGEKLEIHSNPELTEASKRHYLHSSDVADAILFLMKNHKVGDKYNIVANEETDNLDLAKKIAQILDLPLNYELVDPKITRPRHDFRYAISGEKLKKMGWEQKVNLQEGLEETVRWFLSNKDWR